MSKVLLMLFGLLGITLGIGLLVLAGLAFENTGLQLLLRSVPIAFAPLSGGVLLMGIARLIGLLEQVTEGLKHANDRLSLL